MKRKSKSLRNSMVLQSILFNKKYFNHRKAKKWLKKHNIKPLKLDKTKNYYRFRIKSPSLFRKNTFRIKKIKDGIKILIGKLKKKL